MRKLKKFGITAAVLAAVVMSAATAMAAGWTGKDKNNSTIANNAADLAQQIVIGKSLKMPLNWTPDMIEITFSVTPEGFSADNADYTPVDGLNFGTDGTVKLEKKDFSAKKDEKTQVKYWGAETGNLVDYIEYKGQKGLSAIAAIAEEKQSTGTVKFTVTESDFDYTDEDETYDIASEASYDLVFWVDYVADSDGKGSYEVTTITDTKTKNDDGTDAAEKVDPTPGSTEVTETTYKDHYLIIPKKGTKLNYKLSGMLFNNDITKKDMEDKGPKPGHCGFTLTKTNVGGDPNQTFKFKVELTPPDLGYVYKDTAVCINYYKKDDLNTCIKTDDIDNYSKGKEIELKGDEIVVFEFLYNSTLIKITEEGTPSYLPSYKSTYGDSTGVIVNTGDSLSVSGLTETKTDYVDFTNTYQSVTPTGIIMNNLPFIMMIILGIFAAAGTFVFRTRRRLTD